MELTHKQLEIINYNVLPIGFGSERNVFEHRYDPELLVGVEHQKKTESEMNLYQLTNNIFYRMFPEHFVEVLETGSDGVQDYSVFRRVRTQHSGFGTQYVQGKEIFFKKIAEIFPDSYTAYSTSLRRDGLPQQGIEEEFDFDGDTPNILIDNSNNPVYIDKVDPRLLLLIDKGKLQEKYKGREKEYESLLSKIDEGIDLYNTVKKDKEDFERLYDSIY